MGTCLDSLSRSEESALTDSFGPRPIPSGKSIQNNLRQLRWCLAAEAVRRYPAIKRRFVHFKHTSTDEKSTTYLQERQFEELVEEHCTNWSTKGLLHGDFGLIMGIAVWFASMAFGAIHAAAWYDYFPSTAEA